MSEILGFLRYNGTEKHVTFERFENTASRANDNVILTYVTEHITEDDVRFCDDP